MASPRQCWWTGLSQDTGTQQQGMHFRVSFICGHLHVCSGRGTGGIRACGGRGELDQRGLSDLDEPHCRNGWGGLKGMRMQC